jgi:hypothetical protein
MGCLSEGLSYVSFPTQALVGVPFSGGPEEPCETGFLAYSLAKGVRSDVTCNRLALGPAPPAPVGQPGQSRGFGYFFLLN